MIYLPEAFKILVDDFRQYRYFQRPLFTLITGSSGAGKSTLFGELFPMVSSKNVTILEFDQFIYGKTYNVNWEFSVITAIIRHVMTRNKQLILFCYPSTLRQLLRTIGKIYWLSGFPQGWMESAVHIKWLFHDASETYYDRITSRNGLQASWQPTKEEVNKMLLKHKVIYDNFYYYKGAPTVIPFDIEAIFIRSDDGPTAILQKCNLLNPYVLSPPFVHRYLNELSEYIDNRDDLNDEAIKSLHAYIETFRKTNQTIKKQNQQ